MENRELGFGTAFETGFTSRVILILSFRVFMRSGENSFQYVEYFYFYCVVYFLVTFSSQQDLPFFTILGCILYNIGLWGHISSINIAHMVTKL